MKDNGELEEKIEYQYNKTEHAERVAHDTEVEMMNVNAMLIHEKE